MNRLNEIARSWVGTPFFPHAYVKGNGVSCQTFVTALYSELGVLPKDFRVPEGPLEWSQSQTESLIEPFVDNQLRAWLAPVDEPPQPGDLLGFQAGGCVHHLGIFLGGEPPYFIHCLRKYGVVLDRIDDATYLQRLRRVWRPLA